MVQLTPEERQRIYEEERAVRRRRNAKYGRALAIVLGLGLVAGWFIMHDGSAPRASASGSAETAAEYPSTEPTPPTDPATPTAPTAPTATPPPAETVALNALISDYEQNVVMADSRYKAKRIRTTGRVFFIDKLPRVGAYIVLRRPQDTISGAQFLFPPEREYQVATLKPGDIAIVEGTVAGRFSLNVILVESDLIRRINLSEEARR